MRTITFDENEWQIVPKTPTFLMMEAGDELAESHDCLKIYAAMLAISPEPAPESSPHPIHV